jgi:Fe-S cluster biosynthesis and repair protein YggX
MTRKVKCAKLGQELPGLEFAPIKGELGRRIYESVSAEAWKMWLKHSTMIINEYRLNPADPEAQAVLRQQMEQFFFGPGVEPPPDYKPPQHH